MTGTDEPIGFIRAILRNCGNGRINLIAVVLIAFDNCGGII